MPMKRRKSEWSDRHFRRMLKAETDKEWKEIVAEVDATSNEDNEDEVEYFDARNELYDNEDHFLCESDHESMSEEMQRAESLCSLCQEDEVMSQVDDDDTCLDYDTCSEPRSDDEDEATDDHNEEPINVEEESREIRSKKVKNSLTILCLAFSIPQIVLTFILLILRNNTDLLLPRDSRTLLKTPRYSIVRAMGSGHYTHFGLSKAVEDILKEYRRRGTEKAELNLTFNIDGLPLFQSTGKSLWLILCSDRNLHDVYIVGMYWGYEKPTSPNEFLTPFVNEAVQLCENGFESRKKNVKVIFHALICDAPAKSMVLNTKGHSGFDSCSKCTIHGKYGYIVKNGKKTGGRVCFPSLRRYHSRTDRKFSEGRYIGKYQQGPTEISRIPGFLGVTRVPLDYMHLVLLGVMKKMLHLWLHGPRGIYRLRPRDVECIDDRLKELKKTMPREFSRRIRSITKFKFWKATEFRTFLLYTGPVVLKGIANDEVYANFMLLHSGIKTLVDASLVKVEENINNAENCSKNFVRTYKVVYGGVLMTHNIHNLLHLASDVRTFGDVDSFSAFKFENHMTFVKRQVRMYNHPLQQISRRYAEIAAVDFLNESLRDCKTSLKKCHSSGPVPSDAPTTVGQYREFDNAILSIRCDTENDNCVRLKSGCTVVVKNILDCGLDGTYIVGRQHAATGLVYTTPNKSECYGIYKVQENGPLMSWKADEIASKVWQMRLEGEVMVFPLLMGEKSAKVRMSRSSGLWTK